MSTKGTENNIAVGISPLHTRQLAWSAIALVWIGILFTYHSQVALVVEAWETLPSHAHGYVVLLVVAYLAWGKREALASTPIAPSKAGFVALLFAGAAGFAGEMVSAGVVVQFALVFMLISAVWAVMGDRAFRILVGPLSFLLFAIPFGHDILPTLMDWTANATVVGLRASGVPVLQEDRNFIIPSGSWSVVEACAGIRYLLTSLFVGSIFAYITYTKWQKRLIFILWMMVLPLLANWLRAYTIVMVAHLSNNEWGLGLSHLTLGWVIFGVTMLGSFALGARWRDQEIYWEKKPSVSAAPAVITTGAALLAMTLALGWFQLANYFQNLPLRPAPLLDLSSSLKDLEKIEPTLPMVIPKFAGAAAIHQATYRFETGEIALSLAYYRNQRQGEELINVFNTIEPTHKWLWKSSRKLPSLGNGIPELQLESYTKAEAQAIVGKVYWVGGRTTTSDILSKIYQAISLVTGNGDDGAMIVITATNSKSADAAKALVEAFIRDRLPRILQNLDAIRTESSQ